MVKRISRRFVSLLLTFVTILTILPAMTLPALAATSGTVTGLADTNIGLSFSGDADEAWRASSTHLVGSVISTPGTCGDTLYKSTLTITNKRTTKAMLSFDYAIVQNSGTIEVDGKEVTAGSKFSKELEPNTSIKVYIKSGKSAVPTTITMTNVKLVADATATVTFRPAENGSYTVDGTGITVDRTITRSSMTAYQVVATPATGYQFMGWYDTSNDRYISTAATTALNIESNCTITARFASKTETLFETAGQRFVDLNAAITEAQKNLPATIALVSDGSIAGNYTIPANVTLLIPFDEAKMLYTATPNATTQSAGAKAFRTLTMAAGSSITLASGAAISVGGQYFAAAGNGLGKMNGPYGCIKMESRSAITVKSGASLYAWGFISGSGSVTVEPGGSVYEWYQILDFRGGTNTLKMGNKVFPFNQYAVQNIEVPLTVYAGASETAYTAVNAISGINPTSIPFIADTGMFKLSSGSLTKAYDGSTDRMIYTINGEAELNSLTLTLAGNEVNSSKYVLPLTNNMTVNLTQGSKLTVNQTVALLPGVEVSIARNAELEVPNGQSMYIYDKQEWGGYCGNGKKYIPVVNAPGRTYDRTDNDLVDVKVDVNGKLTASGGIYTTKSGANICSSEGTGKYVQQGAPGKETATHQYDGDTKSHKIPITAAKLKNADGADKPYTETSTAKAGDTFTYCTCPTCGGGKWTNTNDLQVAEIDENDGTLVKPYNTLKEAVDNLKVDQYIKLLHNTTEKTISVNNKSLYLDLSGCTVKGTITVTNGHKLYGMDSSANKDYVTAPSGKIVGKVTGCAPTYQTPGDTNDRYVAILSEENGTSTLSFHHFNISVTGYRFELATGDTPQCALFFIGKFQGDDAAKAYLSKLGFTLKGEDGRQLGTDSSPIPENLEEIPDMPDDGKESTSEVVRTKDGAFLFEAYLMRSFDKGNRNGYTEKIKAIAQATFKNNVETQDSETKEWSFKDAWTETDGLKDLTPKQQEILKNFLDGLDTPNQTE